MEPKTFEALKSKLISNPVFEISHSSRELFHSNFLAWSMRIQPDLWSDLLVPFDEVDREKKFSR